MASFDNRVARSNVPATRKATTTSTSTTVSRSKIGKTTTKRSGLSLKKKETGKKTQSEITKFFAKTPPSEKTSSIMQHIVAFPQISSVRTSSPPTESLKRKSERKEEEAKGSKVLRSGRCEVAKTAGDKPTAVGGTSPILLSRSRISEVREKRKKATQSKVGPKQELQTVTEQPVASSSIKTENSHAIEDVVENSASKVASKVAKNDEQKSKVKTEIKEENEQTTPIKQELLNSTDSPMMSTDTKDLVQGDKLNVLARQIEEIIPLIRTPVKSSSRKSILTPEENIDLSAYDLPGKKS